ncbi:MAG: hypothetical protein E4H02_08905 [Lentisphaerales bacterium]|nr:MAG: hypothetical protein E4H02_08905 [Lentisphaerales bacterium]
MPVPDTDFRDFLEEVAQQKLAGNNREAEDVAFQAPVHGQTDFACGLGRNVWWLAGEMILIAL